MIAFELTLYFLFGLAVGSFSNVCIYRLPLKQSIILPRSHCPECKTPLPYYFNIPLLSYTYLQGRCSFCQKPIHRDYFIVELLTAFLYLYYGWQYGFGFNLLYFFLLIPIFIIIFCIDYKNSIIPDLLVLIIGILGLVKFWIPNLDPLFTPLYSSAFGALLALIFIGGLIVFYHYVRKIEAMGLGDLKLFITLGFLFGLHGILFILILSSLSGATLGSIMLWRNKKNFTTQIPFGPYIIVATFIYMLVGPQVIVLIGTLIGFLLLAMYMPIFNAGSVVGG
jgi:leader peptidase (prepilin peptidase)/N-methyltransferase